MNRNANQHHLVPNPAGGWDVKRPGAARASVHADTKAVAERLGREISRNQGTEFVIYGLDVHIQRKDSHGRDDFPPRG